MLRILLISALISAAMAAGKVASQSQGGKVALYGQCGGENHNGPTTCDAGLTCVYINQYYSQCLQSTGSSSSTTTQSTTTSSGGVVTGSTGGAFPNGKFRHGIGFNGDSNDFDYVTIWIGTIDDKGSTDFNIW
jgi:hypothetical protein